MRTAKMLGICHALDRGSGEYWLRKGSEAKRKGARSQRRGKKESRKLSREPQEAPEGDPSRDPSALPSDYELPKRLELHRPGNNRKETGRNPERRERSLAGRRPQRGTIFARLDHHLKHLNQQHIYRISHALGQRPGEFGGARVCV